MTGEMIEMVLLANVASTLMLVGLIWFVQVVHYPQFVRVGANNSPDTERRTSIPPARRGDRSRLLVHAV